MIIWPKSKRRTSRRWGCDIENAVERREILGHLCPVERKERGVTIQARREGETLHVHFSWEELEALLSLR